MQPWTIETVHLKLKRFHRRWFWLMWKPRRCNLNVTSLHVIKFHSFICLYNSGISFCDFFKSGWSSFRIVCVFNVCSWWVTCQWCGWHAASMLPKKIVKPSKGEKWAISVICGSNSNGLGVQVETELSPSLGLKSGLSFLSESYHLLFVFSDHLLIYF